MATMSEILGNDAAPLVIEHGGRTYLVRKIDQLIKAEYERWLHGAVLGVEDEALRTARKRWQDAAIAADKLRDRIKADPSLKDELAAAEAALADELGMLNEARDAMKSAKTDIACGKYRFGGPLWVESLNTTTGITKFASLMLGINESEAFELLTSKPDELNAKIGVQIAASFPNLSALATAGSPVPSPAA